MTTSRTSAGLAADILVVDDTVESLRLLSEILTRAGYQVRPADGPHVALESALAQPPMLVLLDVRLPGMDGFEVCRILKHDERTRGVPVIFVSALQDVDDRVSGFDVGGVDFISKPIHESEVLARVGTHMQLRAVQLHLETRVAERTADLVGANKALHAEIAERKRVEETLRESEVRFRSTFEQAAVGIAHVATDGHFLRLNRRYCDIVGHSHDEMLAQTFQDITHPDDLDADLEHVRQMMDGESETYAMEKRYVRKLGEIVWVNLTVSLLRTAAGEPDYFVAVVEDITERKQVEREIHAYRRRLQALAAELTLSEERERRRIAVDLHDEVGQSLAFARIQLASTRAALTEPDAIAKLDEASDTIRVAIRETRGLMSELSPPLLSEIGLAAALAEWLTDQVERKHGLQTEFVDAGQVIVLEEDLRLILFRAARELLTNVVRHAGATKVDVRLDRVDDAVIMVVRDNGRGFDPSARAEGTDPDSGFGLFSIRERMSDLGGTMAIESEPGQGCAVTLTAPLPDER